jgi:hypothetical protein
VGVFVGVFVGFFVGDLIGERVGLFDGASGCLTGAAVGLFVGVFVGFFVGDLVAAPASVYCPAIEGGRHEFNPGTVMRWFLCLYVP